MSLDLGYISANLVDAITTFRGADLLEIHYLVANLFNMRVHCLLNQTWKMVEVVTWPFTSETTFLGYLFPIFIYSLIFDDFHFIFYNKSHFLRH